MSVAMMDLTTVLTAEKSDIMIGKDIDNILFCVSLGRNLIENIRKFIKF